MTAYTIASMFSNLVSHSTHKRSPNQQKTSVYAASLGLLLTLKKGILLGTSDCYFLWIRVICTFALHHIQGSMLSALADRRQAQNQALPQSAVGVCRCKRYRMASWFVSTLVYTGDICVRSLLSAL